uniref:Uncharacterized protein n=1 Tax=Oryza sativa subsp. japonica TaxID=39947 RepID=Q654L5_ORYSJ|nr:hypothetical protein [Oryza sativa Japonica Group]
MSWLSQAERRHLAGALVVPVAAPAFTVEPPAAIFCQPTGRQQAPIAGQNRSSSHS